jgi:hypothetical protein
MRSRERFSEENEEPLFNASSHRILDAYKTMDMIAEMGKQIGCCKPARVATAGKARVQRARISTSRPSNKDPKKYHRTVTSRMTVMRTRKHTRSVGLKSKAPSAKCGSPPSLRLLHQARFLTTGYWCA